MEFYKHANLADIGTYLEEQTKERSIRWVNGLIDKMIFVEKFKPVKFKDTAILTHEVVEDMFKGKTEEECTKIFKKLTKKQKRDFNLVNEQKLKEKQLKFVEDKLEEVEMYLKVMSEIKSEVSKKLKK